MTTAQERLDSVRAEIDQILRTGQRVRKGDREVNRAELASLRVLEDQYAKQAAREANLAQPRSRTVRLYHGGKGI